MSIRSMYIAVEKCFNTEMAHSTIKRILSIKQLKPELWITTIEFEDGGALLHATGVGKDYVEGEEVITYLDDRYNRLKFSRTPHTLQK